MRTRTPLPSFDRLNELFGYDPETGALTSKINSASRRGSYRAGSVAGRVNAYGYLVIQADSRPYFAHRVAWKLATGEEPPQNLDHVNGVKTDNRLANLREATSVQNIANRPALSISRLGVKGVTFEHVRKKFCARICIDGAPVLLGEFASSDEAADAYEVKAREIYGEYAHIGRAVSVFYDTVELIDADAREEIIAVARRLRAFSAGMSPTDAGSLADRLFAVVRG